MSKVSTNKFKCSKCGKEQDVKIYTSINMLFDDDLINDLIDDKITTITCCDCSEEYKVRCPILVNTMGLPCRFIYFTHDIEELQKEIDLIAKVIPDFGVSSPIREYFTDWEKFIARLKEII